MKKILAICLTVMLSMTFCGCGSKDNTEEILVEVGTWKAAFETVYKYVFNQDHTGVHIIADGGNCRFPYDWSYDPATKKLTLSYTGEVKHTEVYKVKITKELLLLTDEDYTEFDFVPGIPVPTELPTQGSHPAELVGDLIWRVETNQSGTLRQYEDDYWELHADGTGVWYENVWKNTGADWIVDDQNRLYIGRVYDDGTIEVHWFTYEQTSDGFTFTNINTDEVIPIVKRK